MAIFFSAPLLDIPPTGYSLFCSLPTVIPSYPTLPPTHRSPWNWTWAATTCRCCRGAPSCTRRTWRTSTCGAATSRRWRRAPSARWAAWSPSTWPTTTSTSCTRWDEQRENTAHPVLPCFGHWGAPVHSIQNVCEEVHDVGSGQHRKRHPVWRNEFCSHCNHHLLSPSGIAAVPLTSVLIIWRQGPL